MDRLRPTKDLIRLIHLLQANKSYGITVKMISREMAVSIRTVKRWLSAIKDLEPDLSYRTFPDVAGKLWYLPYAKTKYKQVSAEKLSSLKTVGEFIKSQGFEEYSHIIDELLDMFKANLDNKQINRIEPDLEVLDESVKVIRLPGPKSSYDPYLRSALLESILIEKQVQFTYRNVSDTKTETKQVSPYGITLGPRAYLVAMDSNINEIRNYALSGITNLKILDNFVEQIDFDFNEYMTRSFGAFHDNIFLKYKLKFKADAAAALYKYEFHSSQKIKKFDNGEIEISFYCESLKEVALECFKWSEHLISIKPNKLQKEIKKIISQIKLISG